MGAPTFLYGLSYYGGLGASEETLKLDLDAVQRHDFNWIRVWATWTAYSNDVAVVDAEGRPRAAQMDRLRRLVADCDRRGLVVDVTIGRGSWTGNPAMLRAPEAHRRAVEVLVEELKAYRNWYLDLANERNLAEFGFTSFAELRDLRASSAPGTRSGWSPPRTRATSATRTCANTCSPWAWTSCARTGPARPRRPGRRKRVRTRYRETMLRLGRVVPLHYQEPLRRGWGAWPPRAEDFVADLRGARAGGAAGWCLS
jgi:hypothetical protein